MGSRMVTKSGVGDSSCHTESPATEPAMNSDARLFPRRPTSTPQDAHRIAPTESRPTNRDRLTATD
jgi:hypothetical protein